MTPLTELKKNMQNVRSKRGMNFVSIFSYRNDNLGFSCQDKQNKGRIHLVTLITEEKPPFNLFVQLYHKGKITGNYHTMLR